MRIALSTALLLATSTAWAVPLELQHQGRLFDSAGLPLTSSHTLDLALYDAQSGGSVVWSESQSVSFDEGYFSLVLGGTTGNELQATDFDGNLWLGLTVDSGTELPLQKLHSVPFAIRSLGVDWADVDGVPASLADGSDDDSLADLALACSNGDLLSWDGSGWVCVSSGAGAIDAGDITTGTLDIDRVPVGATADTLAAGDHTHTAADITGGTFPAVMLPVGTNADQVAAGNHVHAAADTTTGTFDINRLPVGVSSSHVAAGDHDHSQVGTIGFAAAGDACGSSNIGAIRYDGTWFEACGNNGWEAFAGGPVNPGACPLSDRVATTWDPGAVSGSVTLSNGNLSANQGGAFTGVRATQGLISGKWYFEHRENPWGSYDQVGLSNASATLTSSQTSIPGLWAYYLNDGSDFLSDGTSIDNFTTVTTYNNQPHTIGIAVDLDAGKMYLAVDGTWLASSNPEIGSGGFAIATGTPLYPTARGGDGSGNPTSTARFSEPDLQYPVPNGFNPGWYTCP